jgi:hypothetical protein
MTWAGYLAMENIALTNPQRATLVAALSALGPSSDPQPARLNHRRTRLDNDAVIFETLFQDVDLTTATLRGYLANVFGVPVAQITSNTTQQTFADRQSPIVTLTYQSTQRMRVALFGGTGATWAQSAVEARAYLSANAAAWGEA